MACLEQRKSSMSSMSEQERSGLAKGITSPGPPFAASAELPLRHVPERETLVSHSQRSPPEDTMIKLAVKTTLAATAVIALAAPAAAQGAAPAGAQEAAEQQLGNVHFATSCNEVAQRRFNRAMRYQHSFWYRESQAIFEDALKADPQCAIALWGVALSMLNNPHAPPPNENLPRGLAALQKAKEISAKTPRERDFIDALLAFYTDSDKIDHRTRVQSYLKAIEAVAQRCT